MISKLGWLLIQPFALVFLLISLSLLLGWLGRRRLQEGLSILTLVLLFILLFTTTGPVLLAVLENRFPRPDLRETPACVLVLGGGFNNAVTTRRGGVELNDSGDRYLEMLRLARAYPQARLLVSGGDGTLGGDLEGDVAIARRLMAEFGVPETRLLAEPLSRNTYENAVNSQRLLAREGLSRCLLVTSAFHMPRAMGMMRKVGLDVIPWPVDYHTDGTVSLGLSLTDANGNASAFTTALKEGLGLLANSIAGRTSALFPAP